jgi:hypothetical protein
MQTTHDLSISRDIYALLLHLTFLVSKVRDTCILYPGLRSWNYQDGDFGNISDLVKLGLRREDGTDAPAEEYVTRPIPTFSTH